MLVARLHILEQSASNEVYFANASAAEQARFTDSGLKLPSGKGIDFSATSDATGMTSVLNSWTIMRRELGRHSYTLVQLNRRLMFPMEAGWVPQNWQRSV